MNKFFGIVMIHFGVFCQNTETKIADSLYSSGNYTRAIQVYATYEKSPEVYHKIAKAYIAIGNFDLAISNYKRSIDLNSDNTQIKYDYAKLLTRKKKYEEALEFFNDLLTGDSNNPNYHYEQGIVLEKLKDSTAMSSFIKTFELDNSHQKAIFKIAKHLLKKRDHEKSHSYIDKGLESYENNVELISLKAQNYYYQHYYTKAIPWFLKLLDLGESSEFIYEKLSLCYAQNSDYEEAVKYRRQALKYNPYNADAIYVIGTYYERLNDYEKAEEYINNALVLKDVSLSIEYQKLGTLLNRQKKYEAAIQAFQKSLKEDPDNIMSEFYLVRAKEEYYGDLDTKIKLYESFIKKHKDSPYSKLAQMRLKVLKEEVFLEKD